MEGQFEIDDDEEDDDEEEVNEMFPEADETDNLAPSIPSGREPVDRDGEPATPEMETAIVVASDAYADPSRSEFDSKIGEIAAAGNNLEAFVALEKADPELWAWVLTQHSAYESGVLSPCKRTLLSNLPGWNEFMADKKSGGDAGSNKPNF